MGFFDEGYGNLIGKSLVLDSVAASHLILSALSVDVRLAVISGHDGPGL